MEKLDIEKQGQERPALWSSSSQRLGDKKAQRAKPCSYLLYSFVHVDFFPSNCPSISIVIFVLDLKNCF